MKRVAIIGLTAFYLLLTTGMFVCTMHCSAQSLMAKATMQMAGNTGDHCKSDKDCDCCKKHGSFIIKENIKPGFVIQFGQQPTAVNPVQYLNSYPAIAVINNADTRISGEAPPGKSGRSIAILFRSLLI